MIRLLFAGTAVLLISTAPASAFNLNCTAPQMLRGGDPNDPNPVVSVHVRRDNNTRTWSVAHHLRNGVVVERNAQYAITDATTDRMPQWRGLLTRNNNMYMVGEIWREKADGTPLYTERLFDRSRKNELLMVSTAKCGVLPQQDVTRPPQQPLVTPPPQRDTVPIYFDQGAIHVDVILGGMPVRMILDTGASSSTVAPAIGERLLASGQAKRLPDQRVGGWDGNVITAATISISYIKIGRHIVRNIEANITPKTNTMLLGLDVLNEIGAFTVDARNGELILHTKG